VSEQSPPYGDQPLVPSTLKGNQAMTVHPRASLTKALELDLRKAIGEALQKHPDLTEVEIARALHHVLSSEAGAGPSAFLIFHRRGKQIVRFATSWGKAVKAARLTGLRPYDLRRNRTRSTFDRYNITCVDDIRDAMQRVSSAYVQTLPTERRVREITAPK
jgi:hypothetical protein